MKAVDTNVLIRYLVEDEPAQGRKAAAFIENAAETGEQILISNIVLCEMVWVLDSAYRYSGLEIEACWKSSFSRERFTLKPRTLSGLLWAISAPRARTFADCLIGSLHEILRTEPTATFDAALRKLRTFQIL